MEQQRNLHYRPAQSPACSLLCSVTIVERLYFSIVCVCIRKFGLMSLHLMIFRSLDATRISICSFQGTSLWDLKVLLSLPNSPHGIRSHRIPRPLSAETSFFFYKGGIHLLSRAVSSKVPSAVHGLTIVFGMGTGVSHERIDTTCFLLSFVVQGNIVQLSSASASLRFTMYVRTNLAAASQRLAKCSQH